ncbi:MAG: redox-regulated ATPase YchF, partial [Deferribacterales bacterium]|nr:redox-regulated ATPase YchF [Deferribacterales bacterium]
KGASKGEGRGNQFLTHIRQVEAIVHVVRCFESDEIIHVENSVNPARDIDIINTELLISDMDILERALLKAQKASKSGDKGLKRKAEVMEHLLKWAGEGKPLRRIIQENPEYEEDIREFQLLTAKPVLYVANVDESGLENDNDYVKTVREIAQKECAATVKICGKTECELQDLSDEDAREYLQSLGMERSGLENLIRSGYELLGLITFFTAGAPEVRAWTVEKGAVAQKAAGKIHSDIERGFIRAEVCSYADFYELKSLTAAKEKGRLRLEGKEYVVEDGDIMYFRFNV